VTYKVFLGFVNFCHGPLTASRQANSKVNKGISLEILSSDTRRATAKPYMQNMQTTDPFAGGRSVVVDQEPGVPGSVGPGSPDEDVRNLVVGLSHIRDPGVGSKNKSSHLVDNQRLPNREIIEVLCGCGDCRGDDPRLVGRGYRGYEAQGRAKTDAD